MNQVTVNGDTHTASTIGALPQGEYFKRKPESHKVYTRDEYDRTMKRYSCGDTDDISREIWLKKDTVVWIGFSY